MSFLERSDFFCIAEQAAYRTVMIESVYQKCYIFAEINLDIPFALFEFVRAIYKVSCEEVVKTSSSLAASILSRPSQKRPKDANHEYTSCIHFAQLVCYVHHGFAGSYYIVNNDNIFSGDISSEIFVRNYRIFAVNDLCIVAALIEHAQIGDGVPMNNKTHLDIPALIRREE